MEKPPIVIEMSTNLSTGITALLGASSVPCPKCQSQNTTLKGDVLACKEEGCQEKTRFP